MCGICGMVSVEKGVNRETLHKMTDVLYHRGPDDEGYYIGQNVGLGVRRLSIIDLTGGHQPMHNEDKTLWIVFNGEIYNYQEVGERLKAKGHRFSSRSDTEVIIHAYEEWGEDCVNELNGMFAFAIWDSRKQRLFLARDRLGIKPLFYSLKRGTLIFGSEIKSLLQNGILSRDIDIEALDAYFTYGYIPAPYTIFKDIRKLPPGYALVYQERRITLSQYWDFDYLGNDHISLEEAGQQLEELLVDSAKIRLISEVPLGVLLSGGLDSSTVVALLKDKVDSLKTFSMGFDDSTYNELPYARLVASYFQTEHYEFKTTSKKADLLPRLIWFLDEPFYDSSIIPTYLLSKATRRYITVALSGDGGDELFAGYPWIRSYQFVLYYQRLPSIVRAGLYALLLRGHQPFYQEAGFTNSLRRFLWDANETMENGFTRRTTTPLLYRHSLYSGELQQELNGFDARHIQRDYLARPKIKDPRERMLYTDTKLYLPDDALFKIDRMSMANSLEIRVPLLDHRVVEFAASLPFRMKLNGLKSKFILKKIMQVKLPPRILKQRKQGFNIPLNLWLKRDLRPIVDKILLSNNLKKRRFFDQKFVKWMLKEYRAGRHNLGHRIWELLVFEIWAKLYLDKKIDRIPSMNLEDLSGEK